jgi:hypothetical protein
MQYTTNSPVFDLLSSIETLLEQVTSSDNYDADEAKALTEVFTAVTNARSDLKCKEMETLLANLKPLKV